MQIYKKKILQWTKKTKSFHGQKKTAKRNNVNFDKNNNLNHKKKTAKINHVDFTKINN